MATTIYDSTTVELIDGTQIYITPLKIKLLREFMTAFEEVKKAVTDADAINHLVNCIRIAMKQFYPQIKTIDDVEDSLDLKTIYRILDISAGIKMAKSDKEEEKPVADQASDSKSTWETFDLARLESEVFLLGIWKDYHDLESSLSMPELIATLEAKRESDYQERKFLASIQGIDLEANSKKKENAWDRLKAKHFSGGATQDANDVVSLQGYSAQKAGFGIGMGLDYERLD